MDLADEDVFDPPDESIPASMISRPTISAIKTGDTKNSGSTGTTQRLVIS
jgi:hypothetical protein